MKFNPAKFNPTTITMLWHQLKYFLMDTKLAHTIFTLPFVMVTIALTPTTHLNLKHLWLIAGAFLWARTYAMGINRLLDHKIDAKNPRTQLRMLPHHQLTIKSAVILTGLAGGLFVVTAGAIKLWLSGAACALLVLFTGYPLGKRIHWLVHVYLGVCLGLLPIAVTIALAATITPSVVLLSLALMIWVVGFDLLYATRDINFDRQANLHSIPARFGKRRTLIISGSCFSIMILLLAGLGVTAKMGAIYSWGLLGLAGWLGGLIITCHRDQEVMARNSWVGVIYAVIFFADKYL